MLCRLLHLRTLARFCIPAEPPRPRQLTISLRDDSGDVLLARQVSTRPEKINDFFQRLTRERLRNDEPFIAVVEVCGFNDWLIRMLHDYRCHQVIVIQPEERKKQKTASRKSTRADYQIAWPQY